MDLLVKWTLGHMDIIGNEKADEEAKKAVREGSSPLPKLPAPLRKMLPWSKSAAKQEYMLQNYGKDPPDMREWCGLIRTSKMICS